MREFRFYDPSAHWCSREDYGCIVDVVERLKARDVLEFGPGWSTLALIEGGAEHIDSFESDGHWLGIWSSRLANHADRVDLIPYDWADPLALRTHGRLYDLALIDGPRDTTLRPVCIDYALACCNAVLVPLEETGDEPGVHLRRAVETAAALYGCDVEFIVTGPCAGTYALITGGPKA